MKTDANWFGKFGSLVLGLSAAFAVASCGGGGGNGTSLTPGSNASGAPAGDSGAVTITSADDIANLPEAQQKLFTDPGWNQPYIEPEVGVQGLPAPSTEELLRLTRERLEAGEGVVLPRGVEGSDPGSKSASWIGQGSSAYGNVSPPYGGANNVPDFDGIANVLKGEYFQVAKTGIPPYGCNADGVNIGNKTPANAIEDTIAQYNTTALGPANANAVSYVLEGISKPNWFNTAGGGNGGNARCAVYQLYASQKTAVVSNFENLKTVQFAEISFRTDLTQNKKGPGQGVGPGNTQCYVGPAVAHGVYGNFWKVFNKNNTAQPNGTAVRNYDFLIAPANEAQGVGSASVDFQSADKSKVEWQQFYFGSVSACYGGAQIIGLSSTTSSCQAFKDIFTQSPGFFYNPVYGTVLKKWQAMAPASAADKPWKGALGAPVFGPVAYKSGAATGEATRKWYAWGWYFERGFMWYVDNDQTLFPNAADEAQLFLYSGNNTYCPGGTYTQVSPSTFYLGPNAGTFRVNVAIDGSSPDNVTYSAPFYNGAVGRYQIPMKDTSPTDQQIYIAASASGYGGTPDANCGYATYVWAWRDGTVEGPFAGAAGEKRTHLYAGPKPGALPAGSGNKQNVYVIRVQCIDGAGAVAYGDSVPMELGSSPTGGGAEVLLLRNDGGTFNTNYNAIKADLDAIKTANANFTYTEATYGGANSGAAWVTNSAKTNKVVIWYRGGSDSGAPLNNTPWTAAELADAVAIMAGPNPRPILYMTQNLQINNGASIFTALGWNTNPAGVTNATAPGETAQTFINKLTGTNAVDNNQGFPGLVPQSFVPFTTNGNGTLFMTGSTTLGERYTGTGSSGKLATTGDALQFISRQGTFSNPPQFCVPPQPASFQTGFGILQAWNAGAPMSWGNDSVGQRCWFVGYSWSNLIITGGTPTTPLRSDILRNILASLDSTVGAAPTGPPPFQTYSGAAQILTVTPTQFRPNGTFQVGNSSVTGTNYPDTTALAGFSADVVRSTPDVLNLPNAPLANLVAGNDVVNGNDGQFAAPLYAYITDPDSSVGTNGTGVLNGGETFAFGGLLLKNNATWTRVNTTTAGYKPWTTLITTNAVGTPYVDRLPVSGYYVSTTANFAGTTRAFYGGGVADLTFDNAQGPVTLETIAHWDPALTYGASPASVRWSVWPGDGVVDVSGVPLVYFGEGTSLASAYFAKVDVDPAVTPQFTGRTSGLYNASDFNRTGPLAQGRVLEFPFSKMRGWDGDLDRDGVRGEASEDKFPARCRVFSNFTVYGQYTGRTFPNNIPDPTSFVEGGCYLADTGLPVKGITVSDDGNAANDPHTTVTYVSGTTWNINLFFRVDNSLSPFTVDFNPNYPNPATIQTITGSVTPNVSGDGLKQVLSIPVTITPFSGPTSRVIALRATDSGGSSNWFFWPNPVTFAIPPLLEDDFNAGSLNTTTKWFPYIAGGSQMLNSNNFNVLTTPYSNYTMWSGGGHAGTPNFMQANHCSVLPGPGTPGMLRLDAPGVNTNTAVTQYTTLLSRPKLAQPGRVYNVSFKTQGGVFTGQQAIGAAYSFDGGATWNWPATANPPLQTFAFTPGAVPTPLPAASTTYTGWTATWTFLANPAGGRGGSQQGFGTAVRDGFVNLNFGVGNAFTGDYDYTGWQVRDFNTIAAPPGAPQFQLLLLYYKPINNLSMAPGPAFDDVFVN